MIPSDLADLHPVLFHVTRRAVLPSILARGLWSADQLLSTAGLEDAERHEALGTIRRSALIVHTAEHGPVRINDNKPLSDKQLRSCLDDGLQPSDWLRLLNGKVFFWTSRADAISLIKANSNTGENMALMVLDTLSLVSAHAEHVSICPLNSGATRRKAPRRGFATFGRLGAADYKTWRWQRGMKSPDVIREVVIERGVSDIRRFIVDVIDYPANV